MGESVNPDTSRTGCDHSPIGLQCVFVVPLNEAVVGTSSVAKEAGGFRQAVEQLAEEADHAYAAFVGYASIQEKLARDANRLRNLAPTLET